MRRVVCLHGFTGAPESWDEVRAALPAGGRVECPSLLGHDPGDTFTSPTFEAEVDRLARQLRGRASDPLLHSSVDEPWHLAGYSLGGRLALGLLAGHPSLFASATLIGTSPGLEGEDERRQRREADERRARLLKRETD